MILSLFFQLRIMESSILLGEMHIGLKTLPVHPSARALESQAVLTILDVQSNIEKISFSLA